MSIVLPRRWYTAGTNLDVWGDAGTYEAVPFELLPPLPDTTKRDGSFEWLRAAPISPHGLDFGDEETGASDGDEAKALVHVRLGRIVTEAKALGLTVPGALVRFVDDADLHRRVPSCTACYLDVPAKLVELPGVPGRLLRFMNDQQCSLLWYVHLLPDGTHSVVCAAPEIDDAATGDTLEDVSKPRDPVVCAESFEDFVQRFWLENTLWFAGQKRTPLSAEQQTYADDAKKARASI